VGRWGKELRLPYLCSRVVRYVSALSPFEYCDLRLPQGVGDKMVLREVAGVVGVGGARGMVKRAVQFGSGLGRETKVWRRGRKGDEKYGGQGKKRNGDV